MTAVACIVEGDGEVAALPVLLRRLTSHINQNQYVDISLPIRVRRDRFLNREDEFARMLHLAANKAGIDGWVLILLDSDDDCAATMAATIKRRALDLIPSMKLSVVLAVREYECWFIAAFDSLVGHRGIRDDGSRPPPESVRGGKEWLSERIIGGRYRETTDQPALSQIMDLTAARNRSRSFRKLCDEWSVQLAALGP